MCDTPPSEKLHGTNMPHPEMSFEDASKVVGILPILAPHPNATNTRVLMTDLVNKLTSILSQQSADLGYAGMVQSNEIYALKTNNPWLP